MFKKDTDITSTTKIQTIIGPAINVKGDFKGEGDVIIEGTLEGTLKTDGSLHVGKKAIITASIKAHDAIISGEVNGDITIKGHIDLSSSAKITGDINCASISMEKGASFNGKCVMKNDDSSQLNIKESKQ